jgi:hypothetical protein
MVKQKQVYDVITLQMTALGSIIAVHQGRFFSPSKALQERNNFIRLGNKTQIRKQLVEIEE